MATTQRPRGWWKGEYLCDCGTCFGKNLNGKLPFALVHQHTSVCPEYARENGEDFAADHPQVWQSIRNLLCPMTRAEVSAERDSSGSDRVRSVLIGYYLATEVFDEDFDLS